MYDYALSIYQKKMCKVAKNSVRFDKIQGVLSLNSPCQLNIEHNALSILCNDRTWS